MYMYKGEIFAWTAYARKIVNKMRVMGFGSFKTKYTAWNVTSHTVAVSSLQVTTAFLGYAYSQKFDHSCLPPCYSYCSQFVFHPSCNTGHCFFVFPLECPIHVTSCSQQCCRVDARTYRQLVFRPGTLVTIHYFEVYFPAKEAGGGWFHFFPDVPVVPTVSLAVSAAINFYGNHCGLMPLAWNLQNTTCWCRRRLDGFMAGDAHAVHSGAFNRAAASLKPRNHI